MRKNKFIGFAFVFLLFFAACQEQPKQIQNENQKVSVDPLPSWNDGTNKEAIISFVQIVTDKNHPDYVAPADRIATFDNDGTLWSEQPMYFQLIFALERVNALAPEHPEWKTIQPFKAVLENDMKTLMESGDKGLLEIVAATHAGMSTDDFEEIVNKWIATAKHPGPRFNDKLITQMVFQPMLELMDYLRANDFKVYIVSGGGIEFMRPWTDRLYGVPAEQVVGSSIKVKYEYYNGKPVLMRLAEINFIDDKTGKPIGINEHIGKKPILSFGNSDGDRQMLQWCQSSRGKTFQGLVHHDDAEREWAYGPDSHIGTFSNALMQEADTSAWHVVSMKDDWKVIFPPIQ
jgi:phosphoserine phosphatase